jgi:hypothetical protein
LNASTTEVSPIHSSRDRSWVTSGSTIVAGIALLKFALQLHAAPHYGIFRDEMYYLACGQHLGWGYVDHPPLMPFIAWLVSHTLGTSLIAIRLLPALHWSGSLAPWRAGWVAAAWPRPSPLSPS